MQMELKESATVIALGVLSIWADEFFWFMCKITGGRLLKRKDNEDVETRTHHRMPDRSVHDAVETDRKRIGKRKSNNHHSQKRGK
jgi:hypothetical protein